MDTNLSGGLAHFTGLFFLAGIVGLIVTLLFSWSCFSTLKMIPEDKRAMPAWLCWLFFIPFVGYVLEWIMIPFAIPNSIRMHQPNNQAALNATETLKGIGLAMMIGPIAIIIVSSFHTFAMHSGAQTISTILHSIYGLIGIAIFVLWIIYWVKVVSVRRTFQSSSSV